MTARPNQHAVLTRSALHWRDARTAAATLAAVAAWAYAVGTLAVADPEPVKPYVDPRIERILRAGCKLPDVEGAFTAYARINGAITCWRMK